MKTLIINASPETNGNTAYMVNKLTSKLTGDIETISVYNKEIKPCIDCKYCYNNTGACSINDDMTEIYNKIRDCDILIIASPMYFGSFPGPMKNFIDRCQMFWSEKNIQKKQNENYKKGIVLLTAGSKWKDMFVPMIDIARYFFNSIGAELFDSICVNETDKISIETDIQLGIRINELVNRLNLAE